MGSAQKGGLRTRKINWHENIIQLFEKLYDYVW